MQAVPGCLQFLPFLSAVTVKLAALIISQLSRLHLISMLPMYIALTKQGLFFWLAAIHCLLIARNLWVRLHWSSKRPNTVMVSTSTISKNTQSVSLHFPPQGNNAFCLSSASDASWNCRVPYAVQSILPFTLIPCHARDAMSCSTTAYLLDFPHTLRLHLRS